MSASLKQIPAVSIKKACSKDEIQTCLDIRMKVFVAGQQVPIHEEQDGKDEGSDHYLLFVEDMPVGVARVRFLGDVAKIERVAILEEYQGQGLGKAIMCAILSDLKANATVLTAKLGAQTYAIPFYEKLGFTVCGEEYRDAGILHKDMQLFFRIT